MKYLKLLQTNEIYTLMMLLFYTILALIFNLQIKNFYELLIFNFSVSALIIYIASLSLKFTDSRKYKLFRTLYIVPIVFSIYTQVQVYIPFVNPSMFDAVLANWDRIIFGINPTDWIYQFANPYLTEWLQFAYMTYYIIPIILGVELIMSRRENDFDYLIRNVVLAFYLSYIAYLFMPAIGPRFTLHDFAILNIELPGVFATDFFRNIVNAGGGAPAGIANPAQFVNRDCMPSGHTWITIVNMYIAFKLSSKYRYLILLFGVSLIIATIYLRYHYVVDLLAGAVLAVCSLKVEPIFQKWTQSLMANFQEKSN
ncbi:MAG TPA: phosphatase PAP2 family protein [Candidatus Kapabacteria bacterium]|nr:phosphatase PAP2 family protein [Candidatus Kapabacteria bacterium]